MQIEQIERKLSTAIPTAYAITSAPDPKLGEKIILLLEPFDCPEGIEVRIAHLLSPYERPKQILYVDALPLTGNGKTDRTACKKIAGKSAVQ